MSPRLSIIIPVFNVEKYITTCLESVARGAYSYRSQVEVIVVDDGSTDGSGMIADSFAGCYNYLSAIHQKNSGVAQARNTGIEASRGEWIYLADSDDWVAEQGISTILACMEDNSDADILLFDAFKNTEKGETVWEHFPRDMVWNSENDIRELQRRVLYVQGTPLAAPWDKVYRASFLKQNHIRFQKQLRVLDDMVFNMEAIGAASKICYRKERIYHYRYVEGSITNSYKPDRVEQDKKVWEYLQEYMLRTFAEEKWTKEDLEAYRQSYYCRIIKSFSICCRLCFFHEQNKKPFSDKINYIKKAIADPFYGEAFRQVDLKHMEWKLKVAALMVRSGFIQGVYWLHRANIWLEKRQA